jgi:hypothetical protein
VFPYDAALLAAVQVAPQSIPDVLQIMQNIAAICADDDGLKWFNWLYLQVTAAVETRVATAGGFSDPVWLAQLDIQFASLYFSAIRTSLSNQPTPGCWQTVFSCRNRNAVARIQFALAGMNAHINHDLPDAIVNTCRVTATTPDHGGTHYTDYTALNSTLYSLIENAKQELNVRLPGDALPPLTHLEDTFAAWDVSAARESAWQAAEHLWQFRANPLLAASLESVIDGFTTVIGKALLVPIP